MSVFLEIKKERTFKNRYYGAVTMNPGANNCCINRNIVYQYASLQGSYKYSKIWLYNITIEINLRDMQSFNTGTNAESTNEDAAV